MKPKLPITEMTAQPARKAMVIKLVHFLIVAMMVAGRGDSFADQNRPPLAPELPDDAILICAEYPHRTVTNTPVTVYQLLRLGYDSLRDFQTDHGLDPDGIIGPRTRDKAMTLHKERFPGDFTQANKPSVFSATLKVFGRQQPTVEITLTNTNSEPRRMLGRIGYGSNGRLQFGAPQLVVSFSRSRVDDGLHTRSSLPNSILSFDREELVINPGESLRKTVTLPATAGDNLAITVSSAMLQRGMIVAPVFVQAYWPL